MFALYVNQDYFKVIPLQPPPNVVQCAFKFL